MKIPLAEHFHSLQGEGTWTGTPMHFLRLPGCSVGRKVSKATLENPGKLHETTVAGNVPTLPSGQPAWLCHTWVGRPFWCDTDFNKYEEVELEDLLSETWEDHICVTGGEPLLHPGVIEELISSSWLTGPRVLHIETSGTIEFDYPEDIVWVTVSPKQGYLPEMLETADEIKFLISSTTPDAFPVEDYMIRPQVYLSPINEVGAGSWLNPFNAVASQAALARALELLKTHPSWKLSVQLHKYLGVR